MPDKNTKTITILYGTDITMLSYGHTLQNATKSGIEQSGIVTNVNHSLAQQTYEIINTKREIVPIYNFVRENEFPTRHNKELKDCYDISPEKKVLTHVPNSRRVKYIGTVIETSAKVHEDIPSRSILLGDGLELISMRHKARELDVEARALLLGRQDGVSAFYQLSNLALLLSEKEGFRLTLLETMKIGILPVGSHTGDIKEVIKHEETGFIVDIGDSIQAARYVTKLLPNPELYQKM